MRHLSVLMAFLLPCSAFSQSAESNQDRARNLLEASLKDKNPESLISD
jgi:hypothetical protein